MKRKNFIIINGSPTKYCSGCKQQLQLENFSKNKIRADGFCNYCKKCDNIKASKLRKKYRNRKKITINDTKYCNFCNTSLSSKYFCKNKNRKDGLNPYCNKCTSAIAIIGNNKRRAKKHGLEENFNLNDRRCVMNAFHNCCAICDSSNNLCVDHFYPLSKGNCLSIKNAIILCNSCNSKKHAKNPEDFFNKEQLRDIYASLGASYIFAYGTV